MTRQTELSQDEPRIERGRLVPSDAELAVVVMAIDGDARAIDSLASLLNANAPVEIAVVNTGGASLRLRLAEYLERIVLVEADVRRLPGGTRNLGIEATRAPVVAFLAADCMASPDWSVKRLAAHAKGHRAVATALRPAPDASGNVSPAGWATYAMLHTRRAPEFPEDGAALYGASYDRALFAAHGLFREDLRISEDTEFNARISATAPLAWAPEILTLHRYPLTVRQGLTEAFERGRHLYQWFTPITPHPLRRSVRQAIDTWLVARRLAPLTSGEARQALSRAAPLIAMFSFAYGCGALSAACRALWSRR